MYIELFHESHKVRMSALSDYVTGHVLRTAVAGKQVLRDDGLSATVATSLQPLRECSYTANDPEVRPMYEAVRQPQRKV